MKQFLTVLKFEMNNYFKNKSFMITTVLLALAVAGVIIIPTMIPGLLKNDQAVEETMESGEAEETDNLENVGIYVSQEVENVDSVLGYLSSQWRTELFDSEKELREAVEENAVSCGFLLESLENITYLVKDLKMSDSNSEIMYEVMKRYLQQKYLLEKGLTEAEVLEAESLMPQVQNEILGKDGVGSFAYTYVLVFVVYFLIIFYGQMIAVSVTTEKSNRAIEILVTSVNPNSLIFGKVLAGALAGILQAAIILGSAFAAYGAVKDSWGGLLDMVFDIPGEVLGAYAVFGILSYLLYAFIFGMLGALVSKTEDISKSSTPITLIYVASFLIAMFGLSDSESMMIKVASYIPFTSGNAMFIRIAMGSVPVWAVVISGGILVISCVAVGALAAKMFRFGTLHYGNPIKIRTALKGIKNT